MHPTVLSFDRGNILAKGNERIPNMVWDERARAFRTEAMSYAEIVTYLQRKHLPFEDKVEDLIPCPEIICHISLRSYQRQALRAWEKSGKRGVIVLPTGSGKTVIAIAALGLLNQPAIILVPTLDLLEQWKKWLEKELNISVGVCGGGENRFFAITVSTYDSAYLRAAELGNKFKLMIFDEVHHLPAEGYRQIAEMFTAPYRMGLTATFEREDMLHSKLPKLVGSIVHRLGAEKLAGNYLANYTKQRISIDLTEKEMLDYTENYRIFTDYLVTRRIRLGTPGAFRKFIMRSARDKEGRRALLARNRALNIALNSEAKIDALEKVLQTNQEERTIIFTQHNHLVYKISKRFLVPYVTHATTKDERRDILSSFKDGIFRTLVTSKVLDEGIDVPEASLGIIVSGTGSSREFIQRLGRLLRKKEGKQAKLVEIISKRTSEVKTSQRRNRQTSRT
mgnify:CR=1 FL=1